MYIFDPTRATLQEYIAQRSDRRVIYRHRWLRQIRRTVRESDQQGHPESDRHDGLAGRAKVAELYLNLCDLIASRREQIPPEPRAKRLVAIDAFCPPRRGQGVEPCTRPE